MAGLLELKPGIPMLPPEARLVPAADYAAMIETEEVLAEARRQAAAIEAEARRAYEAEKARGYADGQAEAAAETAAQQLEVISRTVSWFEAVEGRMVEVVTAAVRKILGELDEGSLIQHVVHESMRTMRNQRQVTVRVAPDAVAEVQHRLTTIMADYAGVSFVEVTADARLRRGGCILESELGVVDASVDVQLEALSRALRSAFSRTL